MARAIAASNWSALPLLILLYLAAVFVVNPTGNFPLNDDWSYAAAARHLAFHHDWRPSGWTSMPLIAHSLWALPFCALTDCSFEALRAASLAAGVALLISCYFLFRQVAKSAFVAGVGAAAVAFNPVMFELSFTFMTDVLFAALLTTSALVFVKALRGNSTGLLALACGLAVATTLCRQLGLCVPLAFMVVMLFRPGWRARKILRSVLPLALCVLALAMFDLWMKQTGRLPAAYYLQSEWLIANLRDPFVLVQKSYRNLVIVFLYLGLFCAPLLVLRTAPAVGGASLVLRRMPAAVATVSTAAFGATLWLKLGLMPIAENILVPQGLGPLTLHDTYVLGLHNVPPLPTAFWAAVTALSLFGAYRLVELLCAYAVRLVDRHEGAAEFRNSEFRVESAFALVCIAFYLSPIIVAGLFDRYLAAVAPVVGLFVLTVAHPTQSGGRASAIAAGAICACFAAFAVLGTHDYLSWNRARWQAIADLLVLDHVSPDRIDGGFEFNGALLYDPAYRRSPGKSWWWVKDDTYQVTFGPVAGMTELRRYAYRTYLPPGRRFILALRRSPGPPQAQPR